MNLRAHLVVALQEIIVLVLVKTMIAISSSKLNIIMEYNILNLNFSVKLGRSILSMNSVWVVQQE